MPRRRGVRLDRLPPFPGHKPSLSGAPRILISEISSGKSRRTGVPFGAAETALRTFRPALAVHAPRQKTCPVIHEVDEALRRLVLRDAVNGSGLELSFEAPTREWAARRNTPTINIYLYDIREDIERREVVFEELRDGEGKVVERRPPPRRFALVVPRHGLDAAPRGRAPAAGGAARVLPRATTGCPRTCSPARSPASPTA